MALIQIPYIFETGGKLGKLGSLRVDAEVAARLLQQLSNAKSDSAKIDALIQVQIAELRGTPVLLFDWSSALTLRHLFQALPILLVLGAVVYLVVACYPWAVFAWGDCEEHYQQLLGRRKTLWNTVIVSVIVGALVNLFAASIPIPPWLATIDPLECRYAIPS